MAAESLGVNVYRYKYFAVARSPAASPGSAACFLSLVAASIYRDGQTGGRGYIGLAAMIFGNWRPGGLAAGAALFGYTDALQLRSGGDVGPRAAAAVRRRAARAGGSGSSSGGAGQPWRRRGHRGAGRLPGLVRRHRRVPAEFTGMTPYVTTLLVLALASQRLRHAGRGRAALPQG